MTDRNYTTIDGVPIAANITDAKLNNAGGIVAVEVELDIRSDGRALTDTLALRSRVDGKVLQSEPYEDRVEGVSVDPQGLPAEIEVSDVDASLGAEGAVLEILFGGEVVGSVKRGELTGGDDNRDAKKNDGQGVDKLRARVNRLADRLNSVERRVGRQDNDSGGIARAILNRLFRR